VYNIFNTRDGGKNVTSLVFCLVELLNFKLNMLIFGLTLRFFLRLFIKGCNSLDISLSLQLTVL